MSSSNVASPGIEQVKEFWDRRPCNIRHSPAPLGTREYFDQVEQRKYFVEPHIPGFADFERWKGKKVLEVGCGIGTDTMNFARAGAQVTAVDLSVKSLEVAKQRAEVFGLQDRIRFYQANAEELSDYVPVEKYDLVYSFGVIHHTPHPERVLAQLRSYMTPDTTFKVMVYHHLSWKVGWIVAKYGKGQFWKAKELTATHAEAATGCPIAFTYTRASGRKWLEDAGYRMTGQFVDHIFPYSIPEYVKYQYKKVWYFRYLPQPVFRALERQLGWHLCMTARLNA